MEWNKARLRHLNISAGRLIFSNPPLVAFITSLKYALFYFRSFILIVKIKVISPNEKDDILLQFQERNCFTVYKTPQAVKYRIYFVMYSTEDKLWQAIKP